MERVDPTLEYRRVLPPRRREALAGLVAAGYFLGLVAGYLGLIFVEMMTSSGVKPDVESQAYAPVFFMVDMFMIGTSSLLIWGGMVAWSAVTRRVSYGRCWLKAIVVGVLVVVVAELLAEIPAMDEFLDGSWALLYSVAMFVVVPLGALVLMTRKAGDVG